MTTIKPFRAIRPRKDLAASIAALPYDVYNSAEARIAVKNKPLSFLQIDRAEIQFPTGTNPYDEKVYAKAKETFYSWLENGTFIEEDTPCYYLYGLTMNGHTQIGLVGCASIDEYEDGTIKRHENTVAQKEMDRIRHIDALGAQTGPIFLAYRSNQAITELVETLCAQTPLYHFTSEDHVSHSLWKIADPDQIASLQSRFENISHAYIADGHHRAASAVKVGLERRKSVPDYHGNEEFNYFLSVLFPDEQLQIFDYNRVVLDLNGYTAKEFLKKLQEDFYISVPKKDAFHPKGRGEFGMYLEHFWYGLLPKDSSSDKDLVNRLDVSVLQNSILAPLLGINDPRTSSRIRFMGGIRGLEALAQEVDAHGDGVAFSLYPTSMRNLFDVADAGRLMPPKSTWFEPKLRSGLFIHKI
ncbi:MAG: DUF1015 domain-containing protein [Lachnospiraceae bacterium]